jgi:hypothetical protein
MKIPDGVKFTFNNPDRKIIAQGWENEARRLSMERGVYVSVGHEYDGIYLKRIFFKALDREFEGSHDSLRMLNQKAFL